MKLLDIGVLLLLWLVPVLLALHIYAWQMRRRALAAFADADVLPKLAVARTASQRARGVVLTTLAFALLVLALARPAWNPTKREVERKGRDVVFMLDVSRSMMAADLSPNRLWHAKQAIRDCVERVEGDRIALVAFAGAAVVKCPLTFDRGFFRMMLDEASPESVSLGGTQIGDALRKVLKDVFDDQAGKHRDIVLITDGEDHETYPVEAARLVGERGIRLIAIGLGDENEGRRIPVVDHRTGQSSFLTHSGKEVWSKLDAATLRQMVDATPGGKYFNVATGAIDFGEVYSQIQQTAERQDLSSDQVMTYEEKFQVPLVLALLLLCLDLLLPVAGLSRRRLGAIAPAIVALILLVPERAAADDAASQVERGNKAWQAGDYDDALAAYEGAVKESGGAPEALYNRGSALYRKGEFDAAAESFKAAIAAAGTANRSLEAKALHNLGNCAYESATKAAATEPASGMKSLGDSIACYRRALELDPSSSASARNIEVARIALQQLEEQQKQEQQNKGQDQQQGDQQQNQEQQQQEDAGEDNQQQQQGQDKQEAGQHDQQHSSGQENKDQPEQNQGEEQTAQQQEDKPGEENMEQLDEEAGSIIEDEKKMQERRRLRMMEIKPVEKDW